MARLLHKSRVILPEMRYLSNPFALAWGLMFASPKSIKKGACLTMPGKKDRKLISIHMLFCFYPYEVLFVNSRFKVVDKQVLLPWSLSYFPKKPAKYAIESWPGTFKKVKIGDKVRIEK